MMVGGNGGAALVGVDWKFARLCMYEFRFPCAPPCPWRGFPLLSLQRHRASIRHGLPPVQITLRRVAFSVSPHFILQGQAQPLVRDATSVSPNKSAVQFGISPRRTAFTTLHRRPTKRDHVPESIRGKACYRSRARTRPITCDRQEPSERGANVLHSAAQTTDQVGRHGMSAEK
ncbi:hypothetical protein BJV78DRAFT_822909 [Lactifluus subvellereus]|nr:hypothetical protein BJV78DRAFT_822909 [Lactifluus subvellereus]